jgi:glucose/arabinose dehydrogenase
VPRPAGAQPPKPLVTGLQNPTATAVLGGKIYVTTAGEVGKNGDGAVLLVKDGKAVPFAAGLDDPAAVVAFQNWLFVADRQQVWRIDAKGKATLHAPAKAFPVPPVSLSAIAVDEMGTLYVTDAGGRPGAGWRAYRIPPKGRITVVADGQRVPGVKVPAGLAMDSMVHLLVLDAATGDLRRVNLAGGTAITVADGLGGGSGLTYDYFGRLYLTDEKGGRVLVIGRPGEKAVPLATGFQAPAGLALEPTGNRILVVDRKAGTLTALPARVPGAEVDETPLPLETAVAFPKLQWTGWKAETAKGVLEPLRPIVLTHAGDGSNRVFVATQHGVIHVFPNDQNATRTKIFLDIQKKVRYHDNENEEGFLGLAFAPDYKKSGEFYAFYTLKQAKLTNVLSRFRVSKDDPDRADPASEEVLLSVQRPFWNHDGGTICFGPDGYLYVALGDGGLANDPFGHGQNLKTLLGDVLRLDVSRKEGGKPYAIPKDNPFVNRPDARPEIWAYGLRNVWRMAFDRKTGKLWAADVGQNLWEEINILTAGGNYGWNLREGLHPFGAKGTGPRKDLIDPIWVYHHDIGKSITGGHVYRGKRLPELDGYYLYADYVSGRIWALLYDEAKGRVVANRPIRDRTLPILSFGEDEEGDVYLLTTTTSGRGIYRFVRTEKR